MFAKPDIDLTKIRGDRQVHNIKLYKSLGALSVIVIIILLGIIVILVNTNSRVQSQQKPLSYASDDPKEIIKNLSQIYLIPNEDPSILSVADVNIAKKNNPEFYSEAKQNDMVVVFRSTGLAILYRAQENKIITVSRINFDSTK